MILKLIILSCCLISLTSSSKCSSSTSSCSSGGSSSSCCSSSCSKRRSSSSSSSWNYSAYTYDVIPLPSGVGILDSPSYDCRTRNLYFTSLTGTNIFRYSEDTNQTSYTEIPGFAGISFIIPTKNDPNQFVIGCNNSVYLIEWIGITGVTPTVIRKLFTVEEGTTHHMNTAIAGPNGDLYTGTFETSFCGSSGVNGFYRYNHKTGNVQTLPGEYKTTNSLGFDCRKNTLYHLDGCTQQLSSFKVNPNSGKLYKRRVILSSFGLPNTAAAVGLAINTRGHLLIESFRNGTLSVVDPKAKEIIETVTLPTKWVTNSAWGGGCKMDRLYMLTAGQDFDISAGTITDTVVPSPGGSLLVIRGFGKGLGTNKPCVSGSNSSCSS